MPTLSVELTPEAERLIEQRLAKGEFTNESALINEAVLALDRQIIENKTARLRELLAEGIAQYERREFVEYSLEAIMQEAKERIEAGHA